MAAASSDPDVRVLSLDRVSSHDRHAGYSGVTKFDGRGSQVIVLVAAGIIVLSGMLIALVFA